MNEKLPAMQITRGKALKAVKIASRRAKWNELRVLDKQKEALDPWSLKQSDGDPS